MAFFLHCKFVNWRIRFLMSRTGHMSFFTNVHSWKRKQIPCWSKWSFFLVKTCRKLDLSVALEFSPNFWSPLISRTFSWIWSKSAPFCTSLFFLERFSYFFDQRYQQLSYPYPINSMNQKCEIQTSYYTLKLISWNNYQNKVCVLFQGGN